MTKKWVAVMLALVMLAACGTPSTSSSSEVSSSSSSVEESSSAPSGLLEDGRFVFKQLEDPLFTMDYEPREGSVTKQHFGLDFPEGTDTDWLGDSGFDALFNIHDAATDTVYGSVKISTAPADLAKYYNTEDPQQQLEAMQSTFFATENYYNGLRKNVVEDFGYQLVAEAFGTAFEGGWNAFYLEFIDKDSGNHAMRFYLCNDEMNEKFYSMMIQVNVPMDDAEKIKTYRDIIFTLHPM